MKSGCYSVRRGEILYDGTTHRNLPCVLYYGNKGQYEFQYVHRKSNATYCLRYTIDNDIQWFSMYLYEKQKYIFYYVAKYSGSDKDVETVIKETGFDIAVRKIYDELGDCSLDIYMQALMFIPRKNDENIAYKLYDSIYENHMALRQIIDYPLPMFYVTTSMIPLTQNVEHVTLDIYIVSRIIHGIYGDTDIYDID